MKAKRRYWTEAEVDILRRRFPTDDTAALAADLGRGLRAVYHKAYQIGLAKAPEVVAETRRRTLGEGRRSAAARATQFKPGQTSWNAGKRYMPGGNVARGWFKPGRPAHEARNYRPIGTHRINDEGYLERKVTDDRSIAPARRWVGVHRLVWEAAHGPVPPGHAVVFLPGRRTTELERITLDAIELVTRAELMKRNTLHRLPPEVVDLCRLRGRLRAKIKRMERSR